MPFLLPDTNVLIDFGRNPSVRTKLESLRNAGRDFRVGPPALIELVRGMVSRGAYAFEQDKEVFKWIRGAPILDLPRPFMARILQSQALPRSTVEPRHYAELIEMAVCAKDLPEFVKMGQGAGNVWGEIGRTNEIHVAEVDKELAALEAMANRTGMPDLASGLARSFGVNDSSVVGEHFSAAIEFLLSSLAQIRSGAKPRRNNPGLYVDFQLLFYLADPEITFLTFEDFSNEIRKSPQRVRIVNPDSL